MGEAGLSAAEVGKEISEHAQQVNHDVPSGRSKAIAIVESLLLALVALMAAWSGFASAKWSTESRIQLAKASSSRTQASQAYLDGLEQRNFDGLTFNAWFTAFTIGDQRAQDIAARRFRPEFRRAFDAWMATNPEANPDAAPGPTYMSEYLSLERERGDELSRQADEHFEAGVKDGETADDYIRITVLLASVLFIVGLSSHVSVRVARYIMVSIALTVMVYGGALLIAAPKPPF